MNNKQICFMLNFLSFFFQSEHAWIPYGFNNGVITILWQWAFSEKYHNLKENVETKERSTSINFCAFQSFPNKICIWKFLRDSGRKSEGGLWRWVASWRKNENKEYVRLNGNFSLFFQFFSRLNRMVYLDCVHFTQSILMRYFTFHRIIDTYTIHLHTSNVHFITKCRSIVTAIGTMRFAIFSLTFAELQWYEEWKEIKSEHD